MRIRVLRIINRFNLGGITYNVSYLSKYLPAEYDTMLIGGPEEQNEASSLFIPHSLGLQPILIEEMRRSVNPLSDFFAYLRIRKIIREFKPHIVHTHASKAGAIGRLAASHCRVPVVVHTFHGHVFHGYFGKTKTALYKFVEKYLALKSNAVIAISELQKKELTEIHGVCNAQKTHVIPLGFDLQRFSSNKEHKREQFRKQYGFQPNEIVLGIIGRLVPIKDHILFVRAAASAIQTSGRKVKAVIVGDGECREEIEKEIKRLQLSFNSGTVPADFTFTGWIKEVDGILPGLDIVCLTSRNEGTPVSLIEAQAAGKFIVSTEAGGIKDILHPSCGLLSPPGDEHAYISNLLHAIRNFETLAATAHIASDQVISRFSYHRLCNDMDELYRKLLAGKTLQ